MIVCGTVLPNDAHLGDYVAMERSPRWNHMIRRREVIALVGGVLAAPLFVFAQQPEKIWRIGLFHVGLDHVPPALDGLKEGLKALGYEEGKNIAYDFRNLADMKDARATVGELVRNKVDLIVACENLTI